MMFFRAMRTLKKNVDGRRVKAYVGGVRNRIAALGTGAMARTACRENPENAVHGVLPRVRQFTFVQ